MFTNKSFCKSPARLAGWLMVLSVFVLFFLSCSGKLGRYERKVKDLDRELDRINKQEEVLQKKIRDLMDWEDKHPGKKVDPNSPAAWALSQRIDAETVAIDKLYAELFLKIERAVRPEYNDLTTSDINDIMKFLDKYYPYFSKERIKNEIKNWGDKMIGSLNGVENGLTNKHSVLSSNRNEQMIIINRWKSSPAEPNDINTMTELIANVSGIDYDEELALVAQMIQQFDQISGPLPVIAGSTVDQCTYTIEEGLPPDLNYLDDGVLEPNTIIIHQLPTDWTLKAPATITSDDNNLTLDICGNQSGSSLIRIKVTYAVDPNRPDDRITVTFNGIQIGNRTGIVSETLTVIPGRTWKQYFSVLPAGCLSDPPSCIGSPLADLNSDGAVNFQDLAVFAHDWLWPDP
ncbi:MAG: hypothetical protein ABSH16_09550 [Sedimentisphaerales bacterium]